MKSLKITALVLGFGSLGLISCGSDSKKPVDAAVTVDAKPGVDGAGGSGGGGGTGGSGGSTGDGGADVAATDTGPVVTPKETHLGIINAPAAGTVSTGDPGAFTSKYNNGVCQ